MTFRPDPVPTFFKNPDLDGRFSKTGSATLLLMAVATRKGFANLLLGINRGIGHDCFIRWLRS